MIIASVLAPALLAIGAGWRTWRVGPFLTAVAIVGALYASNPAMGFVAALAAGCVYATTSVVHQLAAYYFPGKVEGGSTAGEDDRELTDQGEQDAADQEPARPESRAE